MNVEKTMENAALDEMGNPIYDAAGRNIQKLEETVFCWDFSAQKEHAVKFVGCSW